MTEEGIGEKSYDTFVADHPEFEQVVTRSSWDYLTGSNEKTVDLLPQFAAYILWLYTGFHGLIGQSLGSR